MAELFERDGHCEHCGCPIYTDPMMGTHCACPPWEPKPAAPADGHAWTFDPYHQAHRCTQCGIVSYDATPAGPCTCAPSTWLPPGADDAPPRPVISNDGRCSCGSRLYLGASRCYLCSVPPVDHAPKVDASTLGSERCARSSEEEARPMPRCSPAPAHPWPLWCVFETDPNVERPFHGPFTAFVDADDTAAGLRDEGREVAVRRCRRIRDMFDPFDVLRRMGEEARAEPMTADDEAMLVRIKAAVRRKLGEE